MKSQIMVTVILGILAAGCTQNMASKNSVLASVSQRTSAQVGQIEKTTQPNIDIAYKMNNKKMHFYRSLKEFGTKSGVISDYATESGETFGVRERCVTTKGVFYHLVRYESGGFEGRQGTQTIDHFSDFAEGGYVKASDMKKIKAVYSVKTYKHKQPYYVADPNLHHIWNQPSRTVHYTYISGVFDRLASQQLYATQEETKYGGNQYVFLVDSKGKKLGWTLKTPKVLVAGKYRDPGKEFLAPKKHGTLTKKVQSNRATGNRVTSNESLSMPQRAYILRNKQHQIIKVLVTGMDNRITKITFEKGRAQKLVTYTYRRKVWKTVTNSKKLRTHYQAAHPYLMTDETRTNFYALNHKKLVTVITYGYDGEAKTTVYKSGKVSFKTQAYKHIVTYPLSRFNFE